jgi:hypothetical protein
MLISKKQSRLSDKITPTPKKVKIKKLFSNFYSFFNITFFSGAFVTKVSWHF